MAMIMSSMMTKSMEEIMMMMEKMIANKDKHSEGSNKEISHHRDIHYQREEGEYNNA